jgi:para-nitrobenzyl esterase
MYYFNQDPMYPEGDRRFGHLSPHGQDVDFVFQSVHPGNNPTDQALAKYMLKYWTNFAKYCNPNGEQRDPELPVWPLFKNENSQVMELRGDGPRAAKVDMEDAMWVLDRYFAWRRSQE